MISLQAERVVADLRAYHRDGNPARVEPLAAALEIPLADDLPLSDLAVLHRRYGLSNYTYEGTPFVDIREIFRTINIGPAHGFVDIGAGYGAVVLYGAAVTKARFRAVEAVEKRARQLSRVARRLGLGRIEVHARAACDSDHLDADFVFLNNPFLGQENGRYLRRLHDSIDSHCVIIAINNIVSEFRQCPNYVELDNRAAIADYRFGLFTRA